MSGGVDSSVAAALLAERGTTSSACRCSSTIRRDGPTITRFGSCCTLDDLHDARRVARAIGIPHYIVNFEREFDEHGRSRISSASTPPGRTPIPCVHCNSDLKFATLRRARRRASAPTAVATGHYARVDRDAATGRYRLQARRRSGEGSVVFPLHADAGAARARACSRSAALDKAAVREYARAARPAGRRQAGQPGDLLRRRRRARGVRRGARPACRAAARFATSTGSVLGTHDGIHRFTVGQRKGLGLSSPASRSTSSAIDARTQTVTVGPARLARAHDADRVARELDCRRRAGRAGTRVTAQIRHRHHEAAATIAPLADDRVPRDVRRAAERRHARPGRRVLRRRRRVGGGWID